MEFKVIHYKLQTTYNKRIIEAILDKAKPTQYVIMRLRNDKLQDIHYMTYIEGKNEFIDDRMKNKKEGEVLCLIKYKDYGAYIVVNKSTLEKSSENI